MTDRHAPHPPHRPSALHRPAIQGRPPRPLGPRALLNEARLVGDVAHIAAVWWQLPRRPAGHGRHVLLLPGLGTNQVSMAPISIYLRRLGYRPHGWGLGRNRGNVPTLLPLVIERIAALAAQAGGPIDVVGWSLGGYLGREAARDRPDLVRRIVTLASPVIGGPKYTVIHGLYARRGADVDGLAQAADDRYAVPLTTPVTALYTKTDGIVDWRACIDTRSPNVRHIEVEASHLGIGVNPTALSHIAAALGAEEALAD